MRVLMVLGPGGLRTHVLPEGSITIGRGEDCDVTINDGSVSRRHARIDLRSHRVTVEDLGSVNGTRILRKRSAAETAKVTEVRLERGVATELALDEPLVLGSVTVIVRSNAPAMPSIPWATTGTIDGVVIEAPETKRIFALAERLSQGLLNVLLTGETGVGKEIVAAFIHRRAPRAAGPFVEVNCAALTEGLAESELFGHQRGAFTGATSAKAGLFEAAHGGTLFLDEIGELPLPLQVKLLRVLETKRVHRVGSTTPIALDVRVVSATHRDLVAEVKRGAFRQDLYFRLNGMTLTVPPLRERREDIRGLVHLFAGRTAQFMGLPEPDVEPAALARLEAHRWPGNVRELRNVIDRAIALAGPSPIGVAHIVFDDTSGTNAGLREDLAAEERRRILATLASCDNNQTKAAELLGMPRRTLVARLHEYGMTKKRGD